MVVSLPYMHVCLLGLQQLLLLPCGCAPPVLFAADAHRLPALDEPAVLSKARCVNEERNLVTARNL
jgi:hypothetical protein